MASIWCPITILLPLSNTKTIGSATKSYEAAIYPLYHGYAPGAGNVEVYSEGGTSVWKSMLLRTPIFGVLGAVGILGLVHFFKSGGEGFVKGDEDALMQSARVPAPSGGVVYSRNDSPMPQAGGDDYRGTTQQVKEKIDPYKDLNDEQKYVAQSGEKARIRLTARAGIGQKILAHISWMTPEGVAIETLDLDALRELGYAVEPMHYGIKLTAGKHILVVTPWPLVVAVRESEAKLYNTSGNEANAGGLASVASELAGVSARQGSVVLQAPVPRPGQLLRGPGYEVGAPGPTVNLAIP
ncbi:MAG: hypothetical protein ABI538_01560 [Pseudoxanthomonas sp.]